MRHAKSDWGGPTGDYERRISNKGIHRTKALVAAIKNDGEEITHAWVSPYLRAKLTLDLVKDVYQNIETKIVEDLIRSGMVNNIKRKLVDLESQNSDIGIVIIGHNPSLSSLASDLSQESLFMRTSDTCLIHLDRTKFRKIRYYSRFDYSEI